MNDLLRRILENKKAEVIFQRKILSLADVKSKSRDMPGTRPFAKSIKSAKAKYKIIAEIKRISPGAGWVRREFDPASIAASYEAAGASALSVLTDSIFFGGSPHCLALAKNVSSLPVLRKDFITEPYQIYESRIIGADAVLIMALNFDSKDKVAELAGIAKEAGLEVLFEVHSEAELEKIPDGVCVGINNRDFNDDKLRVDINATLRLAPLVKNAELIISESGIKDAATMDKLERVGADAFLIGTALMKEDDPGKALYLLLNHPHTRKT